MQKPRSIGEAARRDSWTLQSRKRRQCNVRPAASISSGGDPRGSGHFSSGCARVPAHIPWRPDRWKMDSQRRASIFDQMIDTQVWVLIADVSLSQTEIYTSAWTVTHDEANFSQPDDFIPERWLSPDNKDRKEASQPFSLGLRGCLGRK